VLTIGDDLRKILRGPGLSTMYIEGAMIEAGAEDGGVSGSTGLPLPSRLGDLGRVSFNTAMPNSPHPIIIY